MNAPGAAGKIGRALRGELVALFESRNASPRNAAD
jgi:hypothetical protein